MGRPLLCVCASKNCDAVSQSADDKQKGVYFDLQELIFAQKLKRSSNTQLWACCQEHKIQALMSVMKDMPYHTKNEDIILE